MDTMVGSRGFCGFARKGAVTGLALWFVAASSVAGQYTVQYSSPNGYFTITPTGGNPPPPPTQQPYAALTGGGWGGSAAVKPQGGGGNGIQPNFDVYTPGSVQSNGSISATLVWDGGPNHDPAPSCVIVEEQTTASYIGLTGSCSNGFDSTWTQDPYGAHTSYTTFSVVNNPGANYPLPAARTPAANGDMEAPPPAGWPLHASGSVSYAVKVYPADITLTGGIGTNDAKQFLVGQLLTATLTCSPLVPHSYSWSVDGGAPFADFTITTKSGQRHDVAAATYVADTFKCCFAQAVYGVKLSLLAHLYAPDGADGWVTLTKVLTTVLPTVQVTDKSVAGQFLVSAPPPPALPGWCYYGNFDYGDGSGSKYAFGVKATLQIPQAFQGTLGWWGWAQILDLSSYTRTLNGVIQHTWENDGIDYSIGHDGQVTYDTCYPAYDTDLLFNDGIMDHWLAAAGVRGIFDTCGDTFGAGSTQCVPAWNFKDYAMFLPGGSGSQHVPVLEFDWNFSATFNSGTPWTFTNAVCNPPSQVLSPQFAAWLHILTFDTWVWK